MIINYAADQASVMINYQETMMRMRLGHTDHWLGNYYDRDNDDDDMKRVEVTKNSLPRQELVCSRD